MRRTCVDLNCSVNDCDGLKCKNVNVNADCDFECSRSGGDLGGSERVEMVNIKQFVNAGKRNQYVSCGMMMIGDLLDPSDEYQLNFTHRSAHGNNFDFAEHGKYKTSAEKQLVHL